MIPVLATWDICSKRERDWGRSPFMFLAIHTSRRWGEGLLHDCVFPGLRTHIPSGMPLEGREENESLREPCDQIEELFRDLRRKRHAAWASSMRIKIALAHLLDCFKDYFHKK